MRRVYWRPHGVSRTVLILIAIVVALGLLVVELFQTEVKQPYYEEKLAAAHLAKRAMDLIKTEKLKRYRFIDQVIDPTGSGLIGSVLTPITSVEGHLPAKRTSINPNFAAVVVDMLKQVGVEDGDVVAVGCSGSLPALNISVYAGIQTLGLDPIIISSATASQFGANEPDFCWLDMEKLLYENSIFDFRSIATSIGGYDDRGLGLTDEGLRLVREAIERSGLPQIKARTRTFEESLNERMRIYREYAGGRPVKAYINIGGGVVSTGSREGKLSFPSGLTLKTPARAAYIDSVMTRFSNEGAPVVHLVGISRLARRNGFPIEPIQMPAVGEGAVYRRETYNRWLASGILLATFASLFAFVRSNWGFRILNGSGNPKRTAPPEPMV